MEATTEPLTATPRALLSLFVPMALSSWLGTLAPPVINAAIVRSSPSFETALAAYGVARNLIFLLSPFGVMVPTAVLVLVTGAASHRRLRSFLALLAVALTAAALALVLTPLRRPLLEGLLGLDAGLALRTRDSLLVLLLYPPAAIWRAFSQGLLIKRQRTAAMVWAGAAGFAVCGAGVLAAGLFSGMRGEIYGAFLLVVSTLVDSSVLHLVARTTVEPGAGDGVKPSYHEILRYFLPLVATTWVMAASRTVIDASLARLADPALALASFSLAASVVFAFEAPVVMLRSAGLAFDHDPDNRRRLRRFCLAVGASMTAIVVVLGFTPLGHGLLGGAIGAQGPVGRTALWGIRIMAVSLLILSWRQFNYSLLMKRQRTEIIALSAFVRMGFLVVFLIAGLLIWPDPRTAAVLYTLGFLLEALITHFGARRIGAA